MLSRTPYILHGALVPKGELWVCLGTREAFLDGCRERPTRTWPPGRVRPRLVKIQKAKSGESRLYPQLQFLFPLSHGRHRCQKQLSSPQRQPNIKSWPFWQEIPDPPGIAGPIGLYTNLFAHSLQRTFSPTTASMCTVFFSPRGFGWISNGRESMFMANDSFIV